MQQVIVYTGFEMSGIRLYERIFDKIESIGFMPRAIGRLREDGSREAFIRGYRIVYEEKDNHIFIVAVVHSSRLYPRPEIELMP
ncbi:type II toxin-antitoxin system RelE/ParE family toxin [Rodentibacter trehalosifermentans]|uniref:type II toxin-antitoxin system RelE/ParE family toxin n=1 Tax=Rodentibacter trehalosifermentans TaxID=1908263 RepID=UPI00277B5CE5|nr:type II toxin-antitoxin system RelE/ParE family toxin [Rodentibacter trehalosifermentans]